MLRLQLFKKTTLKDAARKNKQTFQLFQRKLERSELYKH